MLQGEMCCNTAINTKNDQDLSLPKDLIYCDIFEPDLSINLRYTYLQQMFITIESPKIVRV